MKVIGRGFPDRNAISKRSGGPGRIVRRVDWPASMTPAEAAQACGVSERVIRGRIERGKLQTVKRNGRVFVATDGLLRAGLLPVSGPSGETGSVSRNREPGQGIGQDALARDVVQLLRATQDRLEVSQRELGRLQGLLESAEAKERAEQAARDAAQAEVLELRARVKELEALTEPPAPAVASEPAEDAPRSRLARWMFGGNA